MNLCIWCSRWCFSTGGAVCLKGAHSSRLGFGECSFPNQQSWAAAVPRSMGWECWAVSAQHEPTADYGERLSPPIPAIARLGSAVPAPDLYSPGYLTIEPGVSANPQARSQITCPGGEISGGTQRQNGLSGIWHWSGGCDDLQLVFTQLAPLSHYLSIFLCLFIYNISSSHPSPQTSCNAFCTIIQIP